MGFEISKRSPLWEGIIFPGIEGDDPRFEFFVATPQPSLKKYLSTAWLLKWNFSKGEELTFIRVPNPCIKVGARLSERTFEAYGPRTQGAFGKMSGSGASLGFDLAPGGFFPFSRKPTNELANKSIAMEEVLPGFPSPEWVARHQVH